MRRKKNERFYFILIVIFSLFITFLLGINRLIHSRASLNSALTTLDKKFQNDSIVISKLKRNLILISTNSNFQIDPNLILESENDQEYKIQDVVMGKSKIVFRFNEFTCKSCIYEELAIMKDFANEIGKENILVLASHSKKRDLYITKRVNNIKFNVYNIPIGAIQNGIDN